MSQKSLRVLLIEHDADHRHRVHECLEAIPHPLINLDDADGLDAGLARVAKTRYDVVVLELALPGCEGVAALERVRAQVPDVPVVVLVDPQDEPLGQEAVKLGAQDYLLHGPIDVQLAQRVLRYAVERHQLQQTLRSLTLIDELTALYNRYGFMNLAEQHLKLAFRKKGGLYLIVAELETLQEITDAFGYQAGDQALVHSAEILRESFRTSDLLARLNVNQFMVLATEAAADSAEIMLGRFRENLAAYNAHSEPQRRLDFAVGVARFDPTSVFSLEALIALADRSLLESKGRGRK